MKLNTNSTGNLRNACQDEEKRRNTISYYYCPYSEIYSSLAQFFKNGLCNFTGIRWHVFLRRCQVAYDLPLTLAGNFTIAKKSCQNLFMSEVLAPCLELFRSLAGFLAELNKGVSKAVRKDKGVKSSFLTVLFVSPI